MTKLTSDWKDTAIPMLTEYYSVLYLLGKTLEEPYDTIERYEHLKKKIQEQGKEGIPIEDSIFADITNAITIIDTLKEKLRDTYKLPMEAH
jgi:DNA-binding MltR family transcriptional regulator